MLIQGLSRFEVCDPIRDGVVRGVILSNVIHLFQNVFSYIIYTKTILISYGWYFPLKRCACNLRLKTINYPFPNKVS